MRHFLTVITILSLLIIGCDDPQQAASSQTPTIPDDAPYSIIDSNTVAGVKRSLNVRLSKKVSEETLRAIALKLKSQDSQDYDRTFITYYLPGMTVGAGAWATTHFTPELEVRILGLSAEEEKKLSAEPVPANREIIGQWLYDTPFLGRRITIFRKSGKLYIERKFKDGSSSNQEILEKKSSLGRRFNAVESSISGDHWVLDASGNLQIRDSDGLLGTAKKIE